jgi:hypothetical protein
MGVPRPILGGRPVILRLPDDRALEGETAAEWLLLEKQEQVGV